jgi:DNA repair exonuclease SbcCD nuclease subunit
MVGVAATYIILNEELLAICIGVPVALVLGLAVAIPVFLRVKEKKLSQLKYRLDSLGLQERVSTMAEFRHDKSYVAHVQREDTMNRLAGMPASTLRIKVSKPLISVIAILLVIVMLLFILATPVAAVINPTPPEPVVPPDPTDEIIDEMIDEIDKIIEETPIPEEDKTEMKETIDEMKDKLDQAQTNEEKQEIIRDTANDLQHRVEQDEYNKEQILENLKKPDMDSSFENSLMEDLAESIEKIDQAQDKLDKA